MSCPPRTRAGKKDALDQKHYKIELLYVLDKVHLIYFFSITLNLTLYLYNVALDLVRIVGLT